MRRLFCAFLISFSCISVSAQISIGETERVTAYDKYQKATVYLKDGQKVKTYGNIFLKNCSFIYNRNGKPYEVDTKRIDHVVIGKDTYITCDTVLAKLDTVINGNMMLTATMIDVEAWITKMRNAHDITSLSLGEVMQWTAIDNSTEKDRMYPLVALYYYKYDDKFIRASERPVWHALPKNKRYAYRAYVESGMFRWSDKDNLIELLGIISRDDEAQTGKKDK